MQNYEIKGLKKALREHQYALTNLEKRLPIPDSPPNLYSVYFGIICFSFMMLVCIILILMRKVKKLSEKLRGWEENVMIVEEDQIEQERILQKNKERKGHGEH